MEYSTPISVGFGSSLILFPIASCRYYAVGGSFRVMGVVRHRWPCGVRGSRNAHCFGLKYKISTLSIWSIERDAEYIAPVRGCNVFSFSSVGTENPGPVTERGVGLSRFLTTLPTSGIMQRRWYTSESVWIIGAMIMIGESQSMRRKSRVTHFIHNNSPLGWSGIELGPPQWESGS